MVLKENEAYAWGFENNDSNNNIDPLSNSNSSIDTVTMKFSGTELFPDDTYLYNLMNNGIDGVPVTDTPVILGGSSLGTNNSNYNFYMDYLKEQMGSDFPPENLNFQGFSAGCRSSAQALGLYLNEQSLNGYNLSPQNLTLCDPGQKGENNYLFNTDYGFTANTYLEQSERLRESGMYEEFIRNVTDGNTSEANSILSSLYPNGEQTIPAQDLATYCAYQENKPVATLFVSNMGINPNNSGSGGTYYKTREDLSILGEVTEQTVVFGFDASHSGYEKSNGKDGINHIFTDIFKDQNVNITDEKLEEILSYDSFKEIGVFNKETHGFDSYTRDMLVDENGERTTAFYEILAQSQTDPSVVSQSDEAISVEYEFVGNNIDAIKSLIKACSITEKNNVGFPTSGSAAIEAINTVYNNYANTSVEFLNSLNGTCGNILKIAASFNRLDSSLADSLLSEGLASLSEIDFATYSEFYQSTPTFDMLSGYRDESGTLIIDKDEIFNVMSDSNIVLSSLLTDIEDTQRLQQQLDSFIGESSGKLTGAAWDIMRSKVDEYSRLCQKKMQYANNMISSIKESMQVIIDYMEEFDCLDMSQIGEIEQGIASMTAQIETLNSLINSTPDYEPIYGVDEEGKTVQIGVRDNTALKESWRQTKMACINIKNYLQKNLDKLNGLPALDSQVANDIITDATSQEIVMPDLKDVVIPNIETISFDSIADKSYIADLQNK